MAHTVPVSGVDITSSVINAGTGAVTKSLAKPVQSMTARSTNAAFDKCYLGVTPPGCTTDGQITAVTWQVSTASSASAKPSWVTWPYTTGSTDKNTDNTFRQTQIQINPTDGT
jgi:hypothetical protein